MYACYLRREFDEIYQDWMMYGKKRLVNARTAMKLPCKREEDLRFPVLTFLYKAWEEAADHVQWVCPRVLACVVRICMVDRETARCAFIDYGHHCGATRCVATAAQLAEPSEAQPEIFLLLKPGHYDLLLPRSLSLWGACQQVLRCLEERLAKALEPFRSQLRTALEPLHRLLNLQGDAMALLPSLDGLLKLRDCCVCIQGGAEITAKCAETGTRMCCPS